MVAKTSTTPRPMARTGPVKSPVSKKKPGAPNGNILSFFKKVPPPEDKMFVAGPCEVLPTATTTEEDLYDDVIEDSQQERFNEVRTSNKRRKFSDSQEDRKRAVSSTSSNETPGLDAGSISGVGASKQPASKNGAKPQRPKNVRRKGPFLDDSDSDEDDDDGSPPLKTPPQEGEASIHGVPLVMDEVSPSREEGGLDELEESMDGDEDDLFGDEEFGEDGEEFRERRFMQEQAIIEANEEAAAASQSHEDDADGASETQGTVSEAECCPICGGSLSGVSPGAATVHVNSCLDGNPTPLPSKPGPSRSPAAAKNSTPPSGAPEPGGDDVEEVDSARVGRRFARAAVARPGQANPILLESAGGTGPQGKSGGGSAFAKLMSGHAEDSAWASAAAAENASRGKQAYERTCPFYKIMPGMSICVDAFRYGDVAGCKAYFLSHFHSDHYIGLTASWSHGLIYCSKVTGSLVKSQLRPAAKYVVELEFEERFVVPNTDVAVTMIPANHCPGSSLFLFEKSIGGGGRMQRILHCGDFRACPAHVGHPQLKPEISDGLSGKMKRQKIDVCYLDTTYLNPRYSFPPQDDVINACAELAATLHHGMQAKDDAVWDRVLRRKDGATSKDDTVSRFFSKEEPAADDGDNSNGKAGKSRSSSGSPSSNGPHALMALNPRTRLLVVCGTYSIGKERICTAIARAMRTKIFATPGKIRILSQLGDDELTRLLTSKPAEAQVHLQSLSEIRAETLVDYLTSYRAHFGRIVGFRPSGWNYRPKGTAANAAVQPSTVPTTSILHSGAWRPTYDAADLAPQRGSTKEAMCFGVPYSEHSSFRELAMFLMGLHIEKVVPTVNVGSEVSRKRMKAWIDRWLAERRRGGLVRVLAAEEGKGEEEEKKALGGLWDGKNGRGGAVRW